MLSKLSTAFVEGRPLTVDPVKLVRICLDIIWHRNHPQRYPHSTNFQLMISMEVSVCVILFLGGDRSWVCG